MSTGALPGSAQGPAGDRYPPAAGVLEQARERQLEQLHERIGRFTSGEVAVYRGELDVTERRRGPDARRLPRGRVVAALVRSEPLPGRPGSGSVLTSVLTIVSAEHELWLRLGQSSDEPGVTRSSLLRPTRATAGLHASCTGCLADLAARPMALVLHGFAAVGRLGTAPGTPVRIQVSGRLERVEPDELRLDGVERLSPGFAAFLADEGRPFDRRGYEGTQRVEREIREPAGTPAGAPPQTRCERVTRYSAERFVDLADLSRFGVRDLTVLGVEICCFDHGGHGGGITCTAEDGG